MPAARAKNSPLYMRNFSTIKDNPDISILIATYNRAEILHETLASMVRLDRPGIHVEFVIIDNNSSDHTRRVIESYQSNLPIRYVFQPRPGKNRALNKALDEVNLGKLVVFTDDDVLPRPDWLTVIHAVSDRHPECYLFGSRVYQIMPEHPIPCWEQIKKIIPAAEHNYAPTEQFYQTGRCPLGANFWVRRHLFESGRRYDETLGPHPTNRISGSESSFLLQLQQDGYPILYTPRAIVGHRPHPALLTPAGFRRRAWEWGRGQAHAQPLPAYPLLKQHPRLWRLLHSGRWLKGCLYYAGVLLQPRRDKRLIGSIRAHAYLGSNHEQRRLADRIRAGQPDHAQNLSLLNHQ